MDVDFNTDKKLSGGANALWGGIRANRTLQAALALGGCAAVTATVLNASVYMEPKKPADMQMRPETVISEDDLAKGGVIRLEGTAHIGTYEIPGAKDAARQVGTGLGLNF